MYQVFTTTAAGIQKMQVKDPDSMQIRQIVDAAEFTDRLTYPTEHTAACLRMAGESFDVAIGISASGERFSIPFPPGQRNIVDHPQSETTIRRQPA